MLITLYLHILILGTLDISKMLLDSVRCLGLRAPVPYTYNQAMRLVHIRYAILCMVPGFCLVLDIGYPKRGDDMFQILMTHPQADHLYVFGETLDEVIWRAAQYQSKGYTAVWCGQ